MLSRITGLLILLISAVNAHASAAIFSHDKNKYSLGANLVEAIFGGYRKCTVLDDGCVDGWAFYEGILTDLVVFLAQVAVWLILILMFYYALRSIVNLAITGEFLENRQSIGALTLRTLLALVLLLPPADVAMPLINFINYQLILTGSYLGDNIWKKAVARMDQVGLYSGSGPSVSEDSLREAYRTINDNTMGRIDPVFMVRDHAAGGSASALANLQALDRIKKFHYKNKEIIHSIIKSLACVIYTNEYNFPIPRNSAPPASSTGFTPNDFPIPGGIFFQPKKLILNKGEDVEPYRKLTVNDESPYVVYPVMEGQNKYRIMFSPKHYAGPDSRPDGIHCGALKNIDEPLLQPVIALLDHFESSLRVVVHHYLRNYNDDAVRNSLDDFLIGSTFNSAYQLSSVDKGYGGILKNIMDITSPGVLAVVAEPGLESSADSYFHDRPEARFGWISAGLFYNEFSAGTGTHDNFMPDTLIFTNGFDSSTQPTDLSGQDNLRKFKKFYLKFDDYFNSFSSGDGHQGHIDVLKKFHDRVKWAPYRNDPSSMDNAHAFMVATPVVILLTTQVYDLINIYPGNDFIDAYRDIGETMLTASFSSAIVAVLSLFTMELLASLMDCKSPVGNAVRSITGMGLMTALAYAGSMYTTGAMLAMFIPLIPIFIYSVAVIGWVLAAIESFIASPIVALGIIWPGQSHEIFGKSEGSIFLYISILLGPALIVTGFICGLVLCLYALKLFSVAFLFLINPASNLTKLFPVFNSLSLGMIYVATIIAIMLKTLNLTTILPEKVLTWIGGQAVAIRSSEDLVNKAKGGFDEGSQKVADGMKKAGEQAKKIGGETGAAIKEAAMAVATQGASTAAQAATSSGKGDS